MTTTTDADVEVSNADTGQVYPSQVLNEVARLDGAAAPAWFGSAALDGWTPKDPYASMRCACGKVHESALIAPTAEELAAEGSTIAEEMTRGVDRKPGWATWLGEIHHADAEWADIVARLRAMPDAYAAPPVERTVVEPVQVSDSYAESRLKAKLMHAGLTNQASVYEELAPENIQDGPPHRLPPPPPPPPEDERQPEGREGLDRMVKRVPTAISAQQPQRDTSGDVSLADYINAIEAAEAVGVQVPVESGDRLEPGTVRASRWARLAAWFGGATGRRRQTEQDESEYDDTALPRQVGVAIGLTLGFFLAFMGVAWIVGVL